MLHSQTRVGVCLLMPHWCVHFSPNNLVDLSVNATYEYTHTVHALKMTDTLLKRGMYRRVDVCTQLCLHCEFILPSKTEGSHFKPVMKAERSVSTDRKKRSIDLFIHCGI